MTAAWTHQWVEPRQDGRCANIPVSRSQTIWLLRELTSEIAAVWNSPMSRSQTRWLHSLCCSHSNISSSEPWHVQISTTRQPKNSQNKTDHYVRYNFHTELIHVLRTVFHIINISHYRNPILNENQMHTVNCLHDSLYKVNNCIHDHSLSCSGRHFIVHLSRQSVDKRQSSRFIDVSLSSAMWGQQLVLV